jgi:para-aminobenzoate synthetase component II
MARMAFIDFYDSFSFNVKNWLYASGIEWSSIDHIYHDDDMGLQNLLEKPVPTVLGPGPHAPKDLPKVCNAVTHLSQKTSLFGICLGHQILGHVMGGRIEKARSPWHGSRQAIWLNRESNLFKNFDHDQATVGIYNSLVVVMDSLNHRDALVAAKNRDEEIMALEWQTRPGCVVIGVQFHPESFLTDSVGKHLGTYWANLTQ